MFIVLGTITIIIGVWAYLCLPDTPMGAGFLEENEIVRVLERVSENQTGVGNRNFIMSQAVELATDPQIYLMIIITVLVISLHQYSMIQTNTLQVFRLERRHHHLLRNYYQELWIQWSQFSSSQHALWYCQYYCLHTF